MFTKFALRSILVLCVIMLLSTLVVGSAVTAKESALGDAILASPPEQSIQGGSPIPGGPGFISVSSFGFKPLNTTSILKYKGALMYNGEAAPGMGTYVAPVNLPHGASLTKVVYFYYDAAEGRIDLYLYRVNLFDGTMEQVAAAISTGMTGNNYVEGVLLGRVINNQLYSYILSAIIPNGYSDNLGLNNVRIDYDYPVYLPTIQK